MDAPARARTPNNNAAAHELSHLVFVSQVLQELVGDKSLERFRVEYEKLHRALRKSHGAPP